MWVTWQSATEGASLRVLVTGATGFVGRSVCRALAAAGFTVRAAVRATPTVPLSGCEAVVVGDIDGATQWTSALIDVQTVVHLAARTHSHDHDDALAQYRRINVDGTRALLTAARTFGVGTFLFMSSIKVNGETSPVASDGTPMRFSGEDPPRPTTPYGQSKLEAEQLLATAGSAHLRTVILRPPLVYGPGQKGNLARLTRAIERGWPLPMASMAAARSLIGVANLADAVVAAVRPEVRVSGIYTLADVDVSSAELARELGDLVGRRARLFPIPLKALGTLAAAFGREESVTKLSRPLLVDSAQYTVASGWTPQRTLRDGLRGDPGPGRTEPQR